MIMTLIELHAGLARRCLGIGHEGIEERTAAFAQVKVEEDHQRGKEKDMRRQKSIEMNMNIKLVDEIKREALIGKEKITTMRS